MTHQSPTPEDRDTGPSTPLGDLRQVRRSSDNKVMAGVLGGLGRHFGIDPLLLRITTVVLAIFGGVGVLLYALGWLLLPREDGTSLLDEARGRSDTPSSGATPLAIVLGIVAVLSLSNILTSSWDGTILLLLAAVGLYLLVRRRTESRDDAHDQPENPPYYGDTWEPIQTSDSDSRAETTPSGYQYAGGWPEGPDWDVTGGAGGTDPYAPPPEPTEPAAVPEPKRSWLAPVTLSLALLAFGLLAINDAIWAAVPVGMYIALPLAIIGLGLLAAARQGRRAKGLIAWGVVLTLVLAPVTAIGNAPHVVVDARPSTLTELDGLVAQHPVGDVSYDLTGVPFTDGDEARVVFEQGVGELTITLPPEVDATVRWSGGVGEATIFDQSYSGIQGRQSITDLGVDGEGGGSITLIVDFAVGDLEVTR